MFISKNIFINNYKLNWIEFSMKYNVQETYFGILYYGRKNRNKTFHNTIS